MMLKVRSVAVVASLLVIGALAQYTFDDSDGLGRRFDGIGGLSGGGATSKLLPGYPEDLKEQILDYLFKPNFGASLHILKVEIGGGSMSGVGSEASHMYFDGDENYERGYEWWMMKEAKKRNPDIKLYGLPWVFSGYVDNGEGTNSPYKYPERTVEYIIKWIQGAKKVHNLTIDYIGEWNEQNYNITYLKLLRKSLDTAGLANVRIVAADDFQVNLMATLQRDLLLDPEFSEAIDVFGVHYSSTLSNLGELLWGKQLWSSEDYSTYNDLQGARCWARILNQNYVNGLMSSTISWNLIAAYYEGMPYQRCGLMTANNPWGGYYSVDPTIWMSAHTTQFTKPGWTYLSHRSGVGHLIGGGSYVSLTSPDKKDLTIVIETIEFKDSKCLHENLPQYGTVAQTVSFKLRGSFEGIQKFHVWFSELGDMDENNKTVLFKSVGELKAVGGVFNLQMEPNQVYTLTTVASGAKGQHPDPPPHKAFPMPYTETFDKYPNNQEPYYIAPMAGSFEVMPTTGEPGKKHLRQMTVLKPVDWCETENFTLALLGNVSWTDIDVSVEVAIDLTDEKAAEAIHVSARINSGGCYTAGGGGIFFYVFPELGMWQLWNDARRATMLAYGSQTSYKKTAWNTVSLTITNGFAEGRINFDLIFGVRIPDTPKSGFAAFGTAGFGHADFRSVSVR